MSHRPPRPRAAHRGRAPYTTPIWACIVSGLSACTGGPSPKADSGGAGDTARDTSEPAGPPAWQPAFDTSAAGSLSSVWGSGPDDIWIVGGTDEQAELYHFDGAAWSPAQAPDLPILAWVTGWGPSAAFAVGRGGGAARFDGEGWTALDTGTTEDLWGCFGFAEDDVWIVGGDADVGAPLILHFDGAAFTEVPLDPAENNRGATTLFKVWGSGGALFAVGQSGLILRYDGAAWRGEAGGPLADQDLISLWGTGPDDITAVGGRSNARIAHFDGSAWTTTAPSALGGLNGISVQGEHEAVVVGVVGYAASLDPATGDREDHPPAATLDLHAVWGDGAGTYTAVGGTFAAPHRGVAIQWRDDR